MNRSDLIIMTLALPLTGWLQLLTRRQQPPTISNPRRTLPYLVERLSLSNTCLAWNDVNNKVVIFSCHCAVDGIVVVGRGFVVLFQLFLLASCCSLLLSTSGHDVNTAAVPPLSAGRQHRAMEPVTELIIVYRYVCLSQFFSTKTKICTNGVLVIVY